MPLHSKHSVIEITGDIKVCCPIGESLMTPYVLKEQEDWFEDEIKFIRKIISSDTKFIDIGANYGLYSLSVAKLCPQGRVWSYEPCAATADYVKESIRVNQLKNVSLIQQAVSNRLGMGTLLNNDNSELNALTDLDTGGEPISLTTLDSQLLEHGWIDIDIIKIDAEGHEFQVLEGGKTFFDKMSPLVMCEIKAGAKVDLGPTKFLIESGYNSYRLVPGLAALVPQDINNKVDAFQLNIFCCKPDRAKKLLSQGRLVISPSKLLQDPPSIWREFIESFPFGKENKNCIPQEGWSEYEKALNFYALSRSKDASITVRYGALQASYDILGGLVRKSVTIPRLLSYVRIAADIGAREEAIKILGAFLQVIAKEGNGISIQEPFIAASIEFEQIPPNNNLLGWMISSALDAYERLGSFSSYFSNPDMTLKITQDLKRLGFCTREMQRRGDLAARRSGHIKSNNSQ